MDAPTDEKLLAAHLKGKIDAFELLVRRHSQELYQFVVRFTNNSAAADDVVQDVFLQVHLSAESFDMNRRFKPWLFTIAANKARDWLRGRARRREVALDAQLGGQDEGTQRFIDLLSDDTQVPGAELEVEEKRRHLRRIVDGMPATLREVLVLAYYHRFPYRDIADILGVPLGTVKSRLHAAVAHFGTQYRTEVEELENKEA